MIEIVFILYEYATLLVPVWIVWRALAGYAKKRGLQYSRKKLLWLQVFVLYVFLVFYVTGAGSVFDIGKYETIVRMEEINFSLFDAEGPLTYILNVIMLVPFGFLLPLYWPQTRSLARTTLSGFAFSLLIECSQLFNRRASDVDDLLMNTIGAALGYVCFLLCKKLLGKFIKEEEQLIRWEHMVYILAMFLGHFFLYDWRALARLLLE